MPIYKIIQKLDNVPKWYIGTSGAYDKLESIDPKGFYFLYDSGEVKFRNHNYMKGVISYSNDNPKPTIGANDRLYVNKDNYEAYIYKNKWVKVFDLLNSEETSLENVISKKRASGYDVITTMKPFMNELLDKAIQNISWNPDTKTLIYSFKSISYPESITNLASNLSFDLDTRYVILSDVNGNELGREKIVDLQVISGSYDDNEKALILRLRDGSSVKIMASALLNIFGGDETESIITSIFSNLDSTNSISMELKISNARENAFVIKNDGLYFPVPEWISNPEGKSGYIYTIVNERIIIDDRTKFNELATQADLQQLIEDMTAFYELKKQDNIEAANLISDNVSGTPSSTLIPTTTLLNKIIGIKRKQKGSD